MGPARKVLLLVCDSLGVGAAPDAAEYGDAGADTLGHVVAAAGGVEAPNLAGMGLATLVPGVGAPPRERADAAWAKLVPAAAGKDSTTGHWELCGLPLTTPFPTFPQGFPAELIADFEAAIGRPTLGNAVGSGTAMIERFGPAHYESGDPIVYTSADSVFQLAAHVERAPLDQLYEWCEAARGLLDGEDAVGRVIARPFAGRPGGFERTADRRDFPLPPSGPTYLDLLTAAGVPVLSVGKVADLFDGRGIAASRRSHDNEDGVEIALELLAEPGPALVFVNLCDFDTEYGHRQDPAGYAQAIEALDRRLPELVAAVGPDGLLMLTGDHGCDPTDDSTDHTRECTPLLLAGGLIAGLGARDLGSRTFADVGATAAELLGVEPTLAGASLAPELGLA